MFSDGNFWYGYKCRGKKKRAGKCWRGRIERNLGKNLHVARRLKKEGRAAVLRFWERGICNDPTSEPTACGEIWPRGAAARLVGPDGGRAARPVSGTGREAALGRRRNRHCGPTPPVHSRLVRPRCPRP